MATRPSSKMPSDIAELLTVEGLMPDYQDRPHYQRNDYLGWILRAKTSATRDRRVKQMLDELRAGGVYMKMDHPPSEKR